MKRIAPFVVVALAGCGNFSQEDLLFLSALPTRASLALEPPGVDAAAGGGAAGQVQQGLQACDGVGREHLRCRAQDMATAVNGLTFFLLDLVDAIAQHPPTQRLPRKRLWGPFYVADGDQTVRFEMTRDGGSFTYCLHVRPGALVDDADTGLACDVAENEGGYVRLLWGTFRAGVDDERGARTGEGEMFLASRHLPRDDGFLDDVDEVQFAYDNTDGVQIVVDFDMTADVVPPHFEYARGTDGAGRFEFDVVANLEDSETAAPEHLVIVAQWLDDRSGRAEAQVTDGDVPAGQTFSAVECWSADLDRVYGKLEFGDEQRVVGDVEQCSIRTELLIAP